MSGGVDSLALTFFLKRWVEEVDGRLVALHVDHALREGSGAEATLVKKWLEGQGIETHVLKWSHHMPVTALQEKARSARYRLLEDFCQRHNILHLCVAHHGEDQRETIAYRASRSSGPDGLAGMAALEELSQVRLLRPLLEFSKEELMAVVGNHPHIDDPSNHDERFWRGAFRREGGDIGISQNKGRRAIEKALARVLARYVTLSPMGYSVMEPDFLKVEKPDMQKRVLSKVLTTVGGHAYPVSPKVTGTLLEKLCQKMKDSVPHNFQMTAGGCLIRLSKGQYWVMREWGRIQAQVLMRSQESFLWDGRFYVHPTSIIPEGLVCRALGEEGWMQIKGRLKIQPYSHSLYKGLPAFFNKENQVIFCPFGDFKKCERMVDLANIFFRPRSRLLRSIWFS